jgi:hypothetical protein
MLATTWSPAEGQAGASELRGTVRDQQGAVLPGVPLTLRSEDTGLVRETGSVRDGTYFVGGLPPGRYEIRGSLPGFRPYVQGGVRLEVGRAALVDIVLLVGRVDQQLTVRAEAPAFDVTSKEIGARVRRQELADLPTTNRSFVGFISLLPGVVPSITSDSFGSEAITLNGLDSRSTNYLIDGANNNDDYLGQRAGTQVRTPIEAIQEFEVVAHQFDAEFGRTMGAVVNAVTRQGTNAWQGSAFALVQDDRLAARDYFAVQNRLPRLDTTQQQYGGAIGGPIARDRAHVFASVEHVRQERAAGVNVPARPDLNTATSTHGRIWNTLLRIDHQVGAAQTWGIRWLRESSPQANLLIPVAGRPVTLAAAREESDVDQIVIGTMQSVFGDARVHTSRVAITRENVAFASAGFNRNGRRQDLLPSTLRHLTFVDQQSDMAAARIDTAWSLDHTGSWFAPGRYGNHFLKFGIQYQFATADSTNQTTLNGVFEFGTDRPFDAADPASYPERLHIRVPGPGDLLMKAHFASAFVQDKWTIRDRATVTLGVRYDIEFIPLRARGAPDQDGSYPVDADNLAPRLGVAYRFGSTHRSVLRGGYGLFYDKTPLELIAPIASLGAQSDSFIASFPANAADPGPSRGELPSDPLLRNGPTVYRSRISQLFPPGTTLRNTGTVYVDHPDRRVPKTHQFTIGWEGQFGRHTTASVDFIHALGRDLVMLHDLNPGLRSGPNRTAPVMRRDPTAAAVLQPINVGRADYDALQVHVERRFSGHVGARLAYTLSYSRGNTSGNGFPQILTQQVDDLRLAASQGPTDFDRRHHLVLSGTVRVPGTGGLMLSGIARALSGLPFSLIDSSADVDRNGILFDPVPAGTYSGSGPTAMTIDYNGRRNGAYGPSFFQLDLRVGYRFQGGRARTLDIFCEVFNLSNRATFDSPVTVVLGHPAADRRLTDFLERRTLRPGGIPRTGQLGARFAF